MTLNGKAIEAYFPTPANRMRARTDAGGWCRGHVRRRGASRGWRGDRSGRRSSLGIARALIEVDPNHRPGLKKAGLLKRDPRSRRAQEVRLRKARRAPQYTSAKGENRRRADAPSPRRNTPKGADMKKLFGTDGVRGRQRRPPPPRWRSGLVTPPPTVAVAPRSWAVTPGARTDARFCDPRRIQCGGFDSADLGIIPVGR